MGTATNSPSRILLAASAAFVLAGCGLNVTLDDDVTRRVDSDTVPVGTATVVSISTQNGAIEVRRGDTDEVAIRSVVEEARDGDAERTIVATSDRIEIGGECHSSFWNPCKVGFVVSIPPGLDVDVHSDNGRIAVDGVGGDLTMRSDNGAIEGSSLTAAIVHVRTGNGGVDLRFDDAPLSVDAETGNGAIAIRLPDDGGEYDVDADSRNGRVDIDVRTASHSGRTMTARSDNGSIEVDYGTR